jgi:putative ABC transport system substrate-binding protein
MTYGTDVVAADERAAAFVDKLLHGAKPADLPIELAPRFDLVINLKTAERIGITIPSSIQVRATDVIRAR